MHKRGQVTIFIILGILIIFIVAFLYYLNYNTIKTYFRDLQTKQEFIPPQVKGINDFVLNCVKLVSEDGLYMIGIQGGYFIPPSNSISRIPYYLTNNAPLYPSKEKIENEISNYIDIALSSCTNDFKDFQDFKISQKSIKSISSIQDKKILIKVEYPLSLVKAGKIYNLKNFELELPTNLYKIYNLTLVIVNEEIKGQNGVCLSCILNAASQNDLHVNSLNYNNSMIYTIVDPNSTLNPRYSVELVGFGNYNFAFAVKY